jgi:uncharacterized membrane protein YgdD (TMEM256/DUF423 family)
MSATRLVFLVSALFGGAGVGLLAAGAHVGGPPVASAGQMLILHALAAMAATLARKAGFLREGPARLGVALLLGGAALFALAVAAPALTGWRPFPNAAPIGGSATILGWLALALAAAWAPRASAP